MLRDRFRRWRHRRTARQVRARLVALGYPEAARLTDEQIAAGQMTNIAALAGLRTQRSAPPQPEG